MRASKWEFEQRFWVFGFIFLIGFGLYALDHVNTVQWLVFQLLPPARAHGAAGEQVARLIFLAGVALVFAVALFRTWATAYLKTEVVHDPAQHANTVVAAGPYRYTRNPLYFGNLFLAIGSGLMASRAGFVFIVSAIWIFGYRLIGREEAMLLQTQGESYRRYLIAVPRFWPALTPRLLASNAKAQWKQALAGESLFWFSGLAMLAFVFTFNLLAYFAVFALGFVVYSTSVTVIRKRARTES